MKKHLLVFVVCLSIICAVVSATAVPAFAAGVVTARPTASKVLVSGHHVAFDSYNINDSNYFKLRDIAYMLNGSEKQFNVLWNSSSNTIIITSGVPYAIVGGEMARRGTGNQDAKPISSMILLDGKAVDLTAYNINDNNYIKLRDMGTALGFGVLWDAANSTINVVAGTGFTPPPVPTPPPEWGDDHMNEAINNNLNYLGDVAGISIDDAIESAYQKYGSYLNDNITKDAIRVGMAITAGTPFYDKNGNISGISSNALKDVNDLLASNDEAALDKNDPEQSIAALWLAASLYYDTDMYNGIPGYDIALPFGLARADSSPGSAENEADTFLSVYRSLFHLTDE